MRSKWRLVAAICLAAPVLTLSSAGATAEPDDGVTEGTAETDVAASAVEVVRLWGQDRYETSLAVARELVRLQGGQVEAVVLAAGHSVKGTEYHGGANAGHNAAIAASLAGRLDAPILFVPPGGLSSEAIALLKDSDVGTAFVVGSRLALPATELLSVIRAGVKIERAVGSVAAARLVGYPEREGAPVAAGSDTAEAADATSEPIRAVVLGKGEVSATLAARAKLPMLDFPEEPLAADATAQFIREHGVTHALMLGGTGWFRSPEARILDRLGVEPVPIGGWDAAAVAEFSFDGTDSRLGSLSQRECPAGAPATVGITSGLNIKRFSHWAERDTLWDAYSAAPLFGWLCSPLLLTNLHGLSVEANAVLYRAQLSGTASVHVIGGAAAVRESVAVHAASPDVPVRVAVSIDDPRSDSGDQIIAVIDERHQVRRYLAEDRFSYITEQSWSPQRRHIAFWGERDGLTGVFVLELATEDVWRTTPAKLGYMTERDRTLEWSSDGALLALSVRLSRDVDVHAETEVLVADMRDRSVQWLTRNNMPDRHLGWSPQGHQLLIARAPVRDWHWDSGGAAEIEIVDIDTRERVSIGFQGIADHAEWSPDAQHVAIVAYENPELRAFSTAGTVHITTADGTGTVTAAGTSGNIYEWSPDGCCIATFWGISGTRIRVIDASAGSYRFLTESSSTHRGGFHFRGWYPDSKRVIATYGWSDQRDGHYTTFLFGIDANTGERSPLPYLSRRAKLRFGGFSPDGTRAVYGATDLHENTHQLVIIEPTPAGDAEIALDATALLDLLTEYPDLPDNYAEPTIWFDWPQLSWTEYGIVAVARQGW